MLNFFFSLNSGYNKVINSQSEFDNLDINANDRIKLNGTFEGNLNIGQDNVTIDGGGITGSQELTSFADEGGGIYSKAIADLKWLYIDGQNLKQAQSSAIAITGVPADNQIQIASGDISGITVTGAKLVYIPNVFSYSTEFIIQSESSGLLTLDKDHTNSSEIYSPSIGEDLYLFNLQDYLVDNFDWCYQSGTLYIKLPSNPTNYTINGVFEDVGIEINANNCTINNVSLSNYYKAGVRCSGNYNLVNVQNSIIHHIKEDGIQVTGISDNNTFANNDIYECGTGGIRQTIGSGASISRNTICNIGTQNTIGTFSEYVTSSRQIVGAAILWASHSEVNTSTIAQDNTIEYNIIYNCAYNGITSHKGKNTLIQRNIVHDVLQVLEDGGGIYTFFFRDSYPELASGIEISENFVYNIPNGLSNSGIYQDNRSGVNNIHHNVVWNVSGKYSSWVNVGSTGQIFNDNTFYGGITATLRHAYASDGTAGPATDVEINRNILIQTANLNCLTLNGNVYGNGDNNYFINPYYDRVGNNTDLAGLQALYSQDANSTELTNYITAPGDPDNEILLITNPSDSELNGTAPSGTWKDVDGNTITNYTIDAWRSLLLLKDLP